MPKQWISVAGLALASIAIAGCGVSASTAATNATRAIVTPLEALKSLPPGEVAHAASSGNLIRELRQRWPQIPTAVWTRKIAAVPFTGPHSLPVVVVTPLVRTKKTQDLLTYTTHGVISQSTNSLLPNPFAAETPGLVMGTVSGRPAFLVTSGSLENRVNLVWWTGSAWRRVWSHVVTTTDQVRIKSVDQFIAGNTPGVTFQLVPGPQPRYRPVPKASSVPYWVIQPKQAALGQPLTIIGSIESDAGKTIPLNWTAPNGTSIQWLVPVAKNGEFRLTKTLPTSINGDPAPTGTYTLSTVLNRWGDSVNILQGFVSVFPPR